jgi:hypothetical protein
MRTLPINADSISRTGRRNARGTVISAARFASNVTGRS